MLVSKHYFPTTLLTSYDGVPAVIVAVHEGEPIVLPVSEETLSLFNAVKKKLGLTHVDLANRLRESICRHSSGEFHNNSVACLLRDWYAKSAIVILPVIPKE